MRNYLTLEEEIEKKSRQRDKKKSCSMKVSGKSVFGLKQIIIQKDKKAKKH